VLLVKNMPNSDSQQNTEGWGDIDWRKVERYVFKLQTRIYAASRHGEVKKVRKLQRTLMRSWSNRVLAARRVTQDNTGKNTAGVDGIKSLTPKARFKLVGQLKLTGVSKPTRRVWIPKPGKLEKRPLGIPTMYDRALQGVVKSALEPEWEAQFDLLANIALHGLEHQIIKEFPRMSHTGRETWFHKRGTDFKSPNIIRYADDFVVLHEDKAVVQRCREIISEWLHGIGLELKPEKTRLTHTFNSELSEDGVAGFDFLGHHIQQFPAGKYHCSRDAHGRPLGFITLITPTKKASKAHQEKIKSVILKHRSSPQAALIQDLNPIIKGWANYYSNSDIKTVGESSRQDNLTYLKLRRWAKRRCKNKISTGHQKYWNSYGGSNWVFSTREGANPLRLHFHRDVACSSTDYVKVKGDKSPYDGDLVYWSSRMGRHPEMPNREALLLKQQKGKCTYCELTFRNGDLMEVDQIKPTALGGKDIWKNLQLLHRHCHNHKTAVDLIEIRKKQHSDNLNKLSQLWEKVNWEWREDIPFINSKTARSPM
jgi:RNA-directed DNA polymerase